VPEYVRISDSSSGPTLSGGAVGPSVINRGRSAAAASKLLGHAVAQELEREGAHVAMCARKESTLEAAAAKMGKSTGHEVFRKALDVTDSAPVAAFVEAVEARFGQIEICVTNSAGPPSIFFKSAQTENKRATADGGLVRSLL